MAHIDIVVIIEQKIFNALAFAWTAEAAFDVLTGVLTDQCIVIAICDDVPQLTFQLVLDWARGVDIQPNNLNCLDASQVIFVP